ncbi:MAG: transketolase C-terminal domain-containing protein [Pseudomonadota bacterium]
MRDHVVKRLTELALEDPRIMLITGDLGFGVLDEYRSKCASQFINAGVAEQNMTGMAAGLALEGFVVFTYSIGNFPTLRCLEQLRNDVCYHDLNVNVLAVGGGFSYGQLGMSHHATEDLSIMRALPAMQVVVPSDPWQAATAVDALVAHPGPSYMRIDKSSAGLEQPADGGFALGKGRTLVAADGVTLVGTGGILAECLEAAERLGGQGISCGVVELSTIKPIDVETILGAAARSNLIVTVEEHSVVGGLGGAVAEVLADHGCGVRLLRVGLDDVYSSVVGSQTYLRRHYQLDAESIVSRIKQVVAQNHP